MQLAYYYKSCYFTWSQLNYAVMYFNLNLSYLKQDYFEHLTLGYLANAENINK